jgi:tetratricopeptide (TPR) repeat protein
MQFLSALTMAGLIGAMSLVTWYLAKRRRDEMQQIESIEELVHLRRWSEAAGILQRLLSKPTRTPQARVHALLFLSTLLGRYHRFDDAVIVQNYLLEHVQLDPASDYALRLGRAMAMLQADHLFDADRAIADLRKTNAQNENDSGGLALVEIYRDVKTGHPDEAVQMFEAKLPVLRKQLGVRVGDAYALAARGYDLLGRPDDAAQNFERATLLTPVEELVRRYAEVKPLTLKFQPAARPGFINKQPPVGVSQSAVESNANS